MYLRNQKKDLEDLSKIKPFCIKFNLEKGVKKPHRKKGGGEEKKENNFSHVNVHETREQQFLPGQFHFCHCVVS